jgi:phenylalanyl-tRNA synthetase beta chain
VRVPLSWLREYVAFDLAPRDLAEELTMRGMEVSAIETAGADWTDVVVGRVLELGRHPNADTLWLTTIDVGDGEPLEIVCGAQNLEVGQLVPAARVGAVLPGERRIERSRIRGVVSNGMLCSAIELRLGTDAEGIHVLGHGSEIAPGTPLADLVGDTVLDVDVKPNRGDALSMVGLAREIAASTAPSCSCRPAPSRRPMTSPAPTSWSASRSRSSTLASRLAGSAACRTERRRNGCSDA